MSDGNEITVAGSELPATTQYLETPERAAFVLLQNKAEALAASELVPQAYRGKMANCMIALELADQVGASPFMVMQNVHIIRGKPSWSASFIIAAVNACGRFSPLRFEMNGAEGTSERSCTAWALAVEDGERLEGPTVSVKMAKDEGWYSRPDKTGKESSKWPTMTELMLRYRSAAFFGRLYAPDVLMGMHTSDEIEDIGATDRSERPSAVAAQASLRAARATLTEAPEPEPQPVVDYDPDTGEVIPPADADPEQGEIGFE